MDTLKPRRITAYNFFSIQMIKYLILFIRVFVLTFNYIIYLQIGIFEMK